MTKTLQIGITSLLSNGKHVLLLESDNEFNIKDFILHFYNRFGYDYHITIYKSNKGYHMISLNEINYYHMLHFCIQILGYNYICQNQLGYAIRQGAFTLRITEKIKIEGNFDNLEGIYYSLKNKPKEILYHQWGSQPISKPHYEVFKLLLNNSRFNFWDKYAQPSEPHIKFFDHGYELKGYEWDET